MTQNLVVKVFSQETWRDFEALFGKHKGVRGGCWCTFHRCTSTQYDAMTRDERKAFQQSLAESGQGCGILIYDAATPIAWCQFGPAEAFPRYDRNRFYAEYALPADTPRLWRITCLFVDKHRRREGLSRFALKAALQHIAKQGGGIVEAFPLDVPGAKYPQYTGSTAMYDREGFQQVARLGKNTILMRRVLEADAGR